MKRVWLHRGKRPYQILKLLYEQGSKEYKEIAKSLDLKEKVISLDFNKLKQEYEQGLRKAPPRRTLRIYLGLSSSLTFLKRRGLVYSHEGKYELTREGRELIESML